MSQIEQQRAFFQAVIAGLVYAAATAMGEDPFEQEVRIPRWAIEDPPEIEQAPDPFNGDWIYRLSRRSAR